MHSALSGRKYEPINVDDLSDGVEEMTVPPSGPNWRKPAHKRLCKRPVAGSSSANPIALDDSDDHEEETVLVVNLHPDSSRAKDSGGGRMSRKAPASSSRIVRAQQNSRSFVQGAGQLATPMSNMRLQSLVDPAASPSPKKFTSSAGSSTRPLKRDYKPVRTVSSEPNTKMDIDSTGPAVTAAEVEEDSSSSDDFWEWSDLMETDDDRELNDYIGIEDALEQKFGCESRLRNSLPSRHEPCKSRVSLKAETASVRFPLLRRKPKKRTWDLWDDPRFKIPKYVHTPLTTDYREILMPGTGILTRRTYLQDQNVFNCWLNIPLPQLRAPHLKELRTSGSINKIIQSNEFIAVASPTPGGGPDAETGAGPPPVDRYNREGDLIVWWRDKHLLLDRHSRSWPVQEGTLQPATKYYTVNDIAFDPLRPNRLVSSGCDCRVRVMDFQIWEDTFSPQDVDTFVYSSLPYDVSFKPNSSLYAVSRWDGSIDLRKDSSKYVIEASNGRDARPGACIWGATSCNGILNNMFFVSTESDKDGVCHHTAFDIEKQCGEYELDINDSSDAMVLDPQGKTLALVTSRASDSSHALSLFDVGHRDGKRIAGTRLHILNPDARSNPRAILETTHASFSPDGILLALARTDHRVHVYDVRYLSESPMAELVHPPIERPRNEHEEYGTTGLHWVEGWNAAHRSRRGLGLVTSGADGCVRLWDVMRGPSHQDESMVLAQTDMDVACFSVGDISRNEHRLVVGDCAGEVYIYD